MEIFEDEIEFNEYIDALDKKIQIENKKIWTDNRFVPFQDQLLIKLCEGMVPFADQADEEVRDNLKHVFRFIKLVTEAREEAYSQLK